MNLKNVLLIRRLSSMSLGIVLFLNFETANKSFCCANADYGRYWLERQEFTDEQDEFYDQYEEYALNNPVSVSCPGVVDIIKSMKATIQTLMEAAEILRLKSI